MKAFRTAAIWSLTPIDSHLATQGKNVIFPIPLFRESAPLPALRAFSIFIEREMSTDRAIKFAE